MGVVELDWYFTTFMYQEMVEWRLGTGNRGVVDLLADWKTMLGHHDDEIEAYDPRRRRRRKWKWEDGLTRFDAGRLLFTSHFSKFYVEMNRSPKG